MNRYEMHQIDQPDLPFIFSNQFYCSTTHLSCICNWHENIEILRITQGRGTVRINEDTYAVEEGDLAVISTNQLHDIFSKENMRYSCLIIDRSYFLHNYLDSNKILFSPIIRDEKLTCLVDRFEQLFLSEEALPYRILGLRSCALQIMLTLCEGYSNPKTTEKIEKKIHTTIKKIIGQIRAESNTDISLDKIAKKEGWSKCYLAREFHRYTGQSMIAFLNTVRCENAKKLLRESEISIGEVGRQCGFNDQTYFIRTFRSHIGKTPGEYRKSHAPKAVKT